MSVTQTKLSKREWETIEIPVSESERDILKLIQNGFHDLDISFNRNQPLYKLLKVDSNDNMDAYMYKKYFETPISNLGVDYRIKSASVKLNKADMIRVSRITHSANNAFEYILLKHAANAIKGNIASMYILYNLRKKNKISGLNKYLCEAIDKIPIRLTVTSISNCCGDIFGAESDIDKARDIVLYKHQRSIYQIFKQRPTPVLVLYTAPTGTGKTLTPLGLSEKYKIIFVCAARHVGLALAKSAVSIGKRTAFAFGCNTESDIRLHNNSAADYEINQRSGGIGRINHNNGTRVEIMICDLQSCVIASQYMLKFNKTEQMILYWDEPTISLDFDTHDLHTLITHTWCNTNIANIILSSATLPTLVDIPDLVTDYCTRYPGGEVLEVKSNEYLRSVPVYLSDGRSCSPHTYSDASRARRSAEYCLNNLSRLRYIPPDEIASVCRILPGECFDVDLNDNDDITNIDLQVIKCRYLRAIYNLASDEEKWNEWYKIYEKHHKLKNIGARITTEHAHTLTDGATIFLAKDINKIASFCISDLRIPEAELNQLLSKIERNEQISNEIENAEFEMEQLQAQLHKKLINQSESCSLDSKRQKKLGKKKEPSKFMDVVDEKNPKILNLKNRIEYLTQQIEVAHINDLHVPNRMQHIDKWAPNFNKKLKPFVGMVSEPEVAQIMRMHISNTWKLLLMIGIGVFSGESIEPSYTELMKKMAYEQRLYLILADTDYIYGTNYQFCHGYIGKDLSDLTPEKMVQAMGRIGRSGNNEYTIRLRDNNQMDLLFQPSENNIESRNMNRLFVDK